jgi:hypothetical protein
MSSSTFPLTHPSAKPLLLLFQWYCIQILSHIATVLNEVFFVHLTSLVQFLKKQDTKLNFDQATSFMACLQWFL